MRDWESRCALLFPLRSFIVPRSTSQEFWGRSQLKPAHGNTSVVHSVSRICFSPAWGPFFLPWHKGQISVFLSFGRENCATHRSVWARNVFCFPAALGP